MWALNNHSLKQPNISGTTIKNYNSTEHTKHPSRSNMAKNQQKCAKTQHKYKYNRIRDSRNKLEQSVLTLCNNNRVEIKQSLPYINATQSFRGASLGDHTICHLDTVHYGNQHTCLRWRCPQRIYISQIRFYQFNLSSRSWPTIALVLTPGMSSLWYIHFIFQPWKTVISIHYTT